MKALESVKAQTFTDYECLIINDGSTDQSAQVVRDWLEVRGKREEVRFRLINKENGGVSAARNSGIAESKGDYLVFLDADDWWKPTFLEEMVRFVEEYPEAGLWASNYIYYKPGKIRVGVRQVYSVECTVYSIEGWSGYINYPKSYYENGEQVVWTGAVLLDKAKLQAIGLLGDKAIGQEIFNTQVKLGEDFLLWARIAIRYKVAFLNKPLAYYNNELTGSLRLTGKLHKPEANMMWHLDEIEDCRLGADWKKLFDRLRVYGLLPYWLDNQYHEVARTELEKVDWNAILDWKETKKYQKIYRQPIWIVRLHKQIITLGSWCKNQIIKTITI